MMTIPRRILGSLCAALAVAGVAALAIGSSPAAATQDYARKESKDCGHCHVSPKGAGRRTAAGREYEANGHRFGVKSWTSDTHRDRFLRASAAMSATWYAEANRVLDALRKDETLPGGLALIDATRDRAKMFPAAWMRAAKVLLGKGEQGLPNALAALAKLESQFPATDQGKEAVRLLDEMANGTDEAKKKAAGDARAREAVRVKVLAGETEWNLGAAELARKLFDEVRADPRGQEFEGRIREIVEGPEKK
ncbi:MAG: hypothetical protein HMLKMBBP_00778 [Planctomycetes bacterium]|nr:hypothetical protein [Planctomycetota bacterium]